MNAFSRGLLIVVLLAVAPCEALGQVDSSDAVQHRNDCRLAAQVLETREPHTKRVWAREYIGGCAEEGPPALITVWNSVPADSAQVWFLLMNSAELRDDRLYQRLRYIAADRSRPDLVRAGAMLVLVRYARPQNAMSFTDVTPPPGPVGRIPLLFTLSTGTFYKSGAVPLPSPVAPGIVQLLSEIAESRSDSEAVRFAAAALAKRVRFDIEAGTAH